MCHDDLQRLIGKRAPEFYAALVGLHPEVCGVSLVEYAPPPAIQERSPLTAEEYRLAQSAAEVRRTGRLSYLGILLDMAAAVDHPVGGIVGAVAYHQPHSAHRTRLTREEVMRGNIADLCLNASPLTPVAFLSRVRTGPRSYAHVPLLDFHVEKSDHSLAIVHTVAERVLPCRYAILETARSYHLVGIGLVSDRQLRHFLYRAILFSPITDHAYIAHQLLDGECALRLTSRGEAADVPTVVAVGTKAASIPAGW